MAEELRFFLRTAVYSAFIAGVYWFASFEADGEPTRYDYAGTALLVFVALATGAFLLALVVLVARGRDRIWPEAGSTLGRAAGALNRTIGFAETHRREAPPLEGGPEAIPTGSWWPILGAAAAAFVTTGFIFGPWLLLPGLALGALAMVGALRQLG